jgi:simple sugar transport system permease protein
MLLAAMLAGGAWAFVPGFLRARWNVNEVLVGLMLNYVAIYLVQYLVHGPWRDPSALGWPYTATFPSQAVLPVIGNTNVHLGLFLGIAIALGAYVTIRITTWGYGMRIVGANPIAAQLNGIPVMGYVTVLMVLGGAVAALAGIGEVSVIQQRLRSDISPGYGYTGFLIAWLARHSLLWIVPAAFLVGGLYSGADVLQLSAGLPSATVDIFMGLVFLTFLLNEQGLKLRSKPAAEPLPQRIEPA